MLALLLLCTALLVSLAAASNVTIAMIGIGGAPSGHDRRSTLAHKQALSFFNNIFAEHREQIATRQMWPPIKSDNCPGVKPGQDRNPPHQRGCALAHRQAWDDFIYLHRTQLPALDAMSIAQQPKLVVFEDDVMEIDPRAPDVAFTAVQNMTTHLLYLGYCFDKQPGLVPPLCAHAYALTLKGVSILLNPGNFDWCLRTFGQLHGNVDDQLSSLAHRADLGLTWAVAGRAPGQILPEFGFNDSHIRRKALTDGFNFGLIEQWEGAEGGLFHQIKYEERAHIAPREGGLYQIKWPHTTVYLYANASFHAFPNVRTFAAMGFDFQDTPVTVVARSQVLAAMGSTLPDLIKK